MTKRLCIKCKSYKSLDKFQSLPDNSLRSECIECFGVRSLDALKKKASLGRADEKERCENDLKYLCKDILGYRDWDIIHDEMHEFTKDPSPYKLFLIPRGHLKSSIITVGYTIQKLLRKPNARILIANAIWDNARGFLREITGFMTEDAKLVEIYGDFKPAGGKSKGWTKDAVVINQRNRPLAASSITTTGVERTQTSQHYDYIVLDDLVARENIRTREQREKIKNFYKDCLNLLEPDGEISIIGTTWHEDDLYNELLQDEEFKVFKRKAIDDEGKILFPKKFSKEVLDRLKKRLGPFAYSSQYLLDPYPAEDVTFNKDWMKKYDFLENEKFYISAILDPSLGKERSDYAGFVVTAINSAGKIFVIMAKRLKTKIDLLPVEIVRQFLILKDMGIIPDLFAVEGYAFQQMLVAPLKMAFENAKIEVAFDVLPRNAHLHKDERIQGLIPYYVGGKIFHAHGLHDLEDELIRFNPLRKSKHDDLIDALSWNVGRYWKRTPEQKKQKRLLPNSLGWVLQRNRLRNNSNSDLFNDMR